MRANGDSHRRTSRWAVECADAEPEVDPAPGLNVTAVSSAVPPVRQGDPPWQPDEIRERGAESCLEYDHLGDTGGAATAPAHPVRPAWCEARTGPNSRDVVEGLVLELSG